MPTPIPEPASNEAGSLQQVLLILRRRWLVLALVWAATVAAVAIQTASTKRLFLSQATLEIRPEAPLIRTEGLDAEYAMYDLYYRSQETVLTSPTLGEQVVKALPKELREQYERNPQPGKALAGQVDVQKARNSFILKVGVVDEDPQKATTIVNALVQTYVADASRRLKDTKTGTAESISSETLPSIRASVDAADKALQAFQSETGYIDFEEHYKSLVESRRRIDMRLTDLRLKRAAIKSEIDILNGYGSDGLSGAFNPAFHNTKALELLVEERSRLATQLAGERKRLKDNHPRIQKMEEELHSVELRMKEAIQGTISALGKDMRGIEGEEKELLEEQQRVEKKMAEAGRWLTRYRKLDSELNASRELYTNYLRKHGETIATSGSGVGNVRVLDYARVPRAPYKPDVYGSIAIAMVAGFILGAGIVFILEQLNDRIASTREVEGFLGLDVLAAVPRMKGVRTDDDGILLGSEDVHSEFEAFRVLRAETVTRLEKIVGSRVVAIVSPSQGEGKSTITANLARVLALEGRRVLILDADLRQPTMKSLLKSREGPGIEGVLRGESFIEHSVQPSIIPGVDVIGARTGMTGAAELAGSPRFDTALETARHLYDFILIDGTPVNLVSESALVARRADATILVVRERVTSRSAARAAKQRLVRMGVKLMGAVVNAAGAGGGASYVDYTSYAPKDDVILIVEDPIPTGSPETKSRVRFPMNPPPEDPLER